MAFSFDGAERVVRLADAPGVTGERAGLLCDRHAQRFTPPVGWQIRDDRTAPEPARSDLSRVPVTSSPQGSAETREEPSPQVRRATRTKQSSVRADDEQQTALDFDGSDDAADGSEQAPAERSLSSVGPVVATDEGDDFDQLLAADSPLLSRAFRTAHTD